MTHESGAALVKDWEVRAQTFQIDARGVLFKSFPPVLNQYLHEWHVAEIAETLRGFPGSAGVRVLDVGCGYGRLSKEIRRMCSRAFLVGLDVSPTFAQLYRRETAGFAGLSNLDGLPVRAQEFDLVLIVTALMYLAPAARQRLIADAVHALKPHGRLLIIENSRHGYQVYTGFGVWSALARIAGLVESSVETGGHLFTYPEIESLVRGCGGTVVRRRGVVRFTFLLPLLLVLCRVRREPLARRLLAWCGPSRRARKFSLQICYEVEPPRVPDR